LDASRNERRECDSWTKIPAFAGMTFLKKLRKVKTLRVASSFNRPGRNIINLF